MIYKKKNRLIFPIHEILNSTRLERKWMQKREMQFVWTLLSLHSIFFIIYHSLKFLFKFVISFLIHIWWFRIHIVFGHIFQGYNIYIHYIIYILYNIYDIFDRKNNKGKLSIGPKRNLLKIRETNLHTEKRVERKLLI